MMANNWVLRSRDSLSGWVLRNYNDIGVIAIPRPAGARGFEYVGRYRSIMSAASYLRRSALGGGKIYIRRYFDDDHKIEAIEYVQHYRDGVQTIAWIERSGA